MRETRRNNFTNIKRKKTFKILDIFKKRQSSSKIKLCLVIDYKSIEISSLYDYFSLNYNRITLITNR